MGSKLSTLSNRWFRQRGAAHFSKRGYFALLLLSVQFGIQPFLNEWYMPANSIKSSVVLLTESVKLLVSIFSLSMRNELSSEIAKWNLSDSLLISFVPSAIYSVQQIFGMYGYQHLDPLIFNLMNQTKLIWSAVFLKVILNKTPSKQERISLGILLIVASMLSYEARKKEENNKQNNKKATMGLMAVLIATIFSGLAGTLAQRGLQNKQRNILVFSAELAIYGTLCTFVRLYIESKVHVFDGEKMSQHGSLHNLFDSGDLSALIPICSTVIGGFGVGMVVKYTSVIHKSYALIMGIFISLLIRRHVYKGKLSRNVYIAVPLTMLSLYLRSKASK